jgi:transcriptional regulator with GAF, ATPase, and Fis domain
MQQDDWLDLTADLSEVALLAGWPQKMDELIARALDALDAVIPHELAAMLELRDDVLHVRVARGPLSSPTVLAHRLPLTEHPSLRAVLAERRARALDGDHHQGEEGDPYDGVLDLPVGHSCMVVPLFAGDRAYGILTFDSRTCGLYGPEQVNLATIYGQVIGLSMFAAEQASLADRLRARLEAHNRVLLEDTTPADAREDRDFVSGSAAMNRTLDAARRVANTNTPVLIQGETGTGKEMLARYIHTKSPRARAPFVTVNCAALPSNLIESELFGHVRGAFSGAVKDRPGRFVVAHQGTIFLDEIGDMPLDVQAKLLRVLQESEVQAVGSDRVTKINVRVLAATHVDLEAAVEAGSFREDLFYRLNVFPLTLPPVRERPMDIPRLAEAILDRLHRQSGRGPFTIAPASLRAMQGYAWPGNVREMVNLLERATILAVDSELWVDLPTRKTRKGREDDEWPTLAESEKHYIERVLERTGGKIYGPGGAADILGVPPSTLQSRMQKLGVTKR